MSAAKSDTPRTDACAYLETDRALGRDAKPVILACFARQLEREATKWREIADALAGELVNCVPCDLNADPKALHQYRAAKSSEASR